MKPGAKVRNASCHHYHKSKQKWRFEIHMTHRKHRFPAVILVLLLTLEMLVGCAERSASDPNSTQPAQMETTTQESLPGRDSPEAKAAQGSFDTLCQRLFADQVSQSYLTLHYTLKDPAAYGITDYDISFGDFSKEAMEQSHKEQERLYQELTSIEPELLLNDQKLTYRILVKALEYEQESQGLELYYEPLVPSSGIQSQLPVLLTEYAFYGKEDVEHYLTLLSDIDRYFGQILDFEKERSAAGLFMTDECADEIISQAQPYLLSAEHNLMGTEFNKKIDAMEGLSDEEKKTFKEQNQTIVTEHFISAYKNLLEGLEALKGTGTNSDGICQFAKGNLYYEYLVHSSIGPSYDTMDDLQKAIEDQIDDSLTAISKIMKANPNIADEIDQFHFSESDPEKILELLKSAVSDDFPAITDYQYVTKYVPKELEQSLNPAFFLVPPIDDYQNCTIYINRGSGAGTDTLFTTLAHEGIPGHLYQNVYFLSHCDTPVRKVLSFLGYSEGWAVYCENYAYSLDSSLSPEVSQIMAYNASAMLGLHALMDLNVNYYGWTLDQVTDYLKQFLNVDQSQVAEAIYQAVRNNPSNYVTYYGGFCEIMKMKQEAETTLKDQFQAVRFHQFLLDMGPAPFAVIEPYFKTWLLTYSLGE